MVRLYVYREVNENYFKKWNPDMAYILGLWFADGNIYRNRFSITLQSKDRDLLLLIKKRMGSTHKLYNINNLKANSLEIRNINIVRDIIKLGGKPNKSLTIKFPDIPKKYLPDFIRGYFDGNGSIYKDVYNKTWNIEVVSGSKKFIKRMTKILKVEIPNLRGVIRERNNNGNTIRFSANNARRLGIFMYNTKSNLKLKRKYKLFKNMGWKIREYKNQMNGYKRIGILKEVTKERLVELLKKNTMTHVAKLLDVNHHSIRKLINKFGIKYKIKRGIRPWEHAD